MEVTDSMRLPFTGHRYSLLYFMRTKYHTMLPDETDEEEQLDVALQAAAEGPRWTSQERDRTLLGKLGLSWRSPGRAVVLARACLGARQGLQFMNLTACWAGRVISRLC
jgi:hypothetical protein